MLLGQFSLQEGQSRSNKSKNSFHVVMDEENLPAQFMIKTETFKER
jgi:hypothetical protein